VEVHECSAPKSTEDAHSIIYKTVTETSRLIIVKVLIRFVFEKLWRLHKELAETRQPFLGIYKFHQENYWSQNRVYVGNNRAVVTLESTVLYQKPTTLNSWLLYQIRTTATSAKLSFKIHKETMIFARPQTHTYAAGQYPFCKKLKLHSRYKLPVSVWFNKSNDNSSGGRCSRHQETLVWCEQKKQKQWKYSAHKKPEWQCWSQADVRSLRRHMHARRRVIRQSTEDSTKLRG